MVGPFKLRIGVAALFLLGFAPGLSGEDVVQELTKINQQRAEAKRQVDYLDRLLAGEFQVLNSRGERLNKQQFLDHIKNPKLAFTELHVDNVHVRVYGRVAVLTDLTTSRGIENGKQFNGVSRYVRIFVNEQGRWRAVLAQATPLKLDSSVTK